MSLSMSALRRLSGPSPARCRVTTSRFHGERIRCYSVDAPTNSASSSSPSLSSASAQEVDGADLTLPISWVESGKVSQPRKRIFSAIQPTGIPHLGNYLGALRQWKDFQDNETESYKRYFAIADLHALTGKHDPVGFAQNRKESFASLIAMGLDPKKSTLFMQSDIPAHSELMWILSTIASTGYLSRMTQWKSKLQLGEDASFDDQKTRESLRLGLFSYPVLQASDILLYRPEIVPVGEDQAQHVEFARTLAKGFNAHYCGQLENSKFFDPPRLLVSPARRVMSLRDPTQKMSKSDPNAGSRILITDSREDIHAKIRTAVTDSIDGISYDPESRPGISNLLAILKHVTRSDASFEEIAADNENLTKKAFKEHVSDCIARELEGTGERFQELIAESGKKKLEDTRHLGQKSADSCAQMSLQAVQYCLGLGPLSAGITRPPYLLWSKLRTPDRQRVKSPGKQQRKRKRLSRDEANATTTVSPAQPLGFPTNGEAMSHDNDVLGGHENEHGDSTDTTVPSLKQKVIEEQEQLEEEAAKEGEESDAKDPTVLPQKDQGVDRPIAS